MKLTLGTPLLLLLFTFLLEAIPSFPGAEGWGAATPGGRGGKVILVTNTNIRGAGSLREALQTPGPRTIVFKVSGVIPLQDNQDGSFGWYLNPENLSYVTVAGQTSPGGVTITANPGFSSSLLTQYGNVLWHDGIFRFLRFRCTPDGEGTVSFYKAHDFILDHCDFSGGTDETTDMGYCHHFNLQWCTIANSQPSSGNWGGSIMWASPNNYISIHHNLWAHHRDRSGPSINWYNDTPDFGMIDYVNNICFDFELYSFRLSSGAAGSGATEVRANFVGNYFKGGPGFDAAYNHPNSQFGSTVNKYASDNIWHKRNAQPVPLTAAVDNRYASNVATRWDMPQVTTDPGLANFNSTLDKIGAWPRDAMNVRTIADVKAGTGVMRKIDDAMITSGPAAPADADNDGLPDFWETGMGLNSGDAADNISDKDGDGYTNIEEYINDLAQARLCLDYYNPVYPIPQTWSDYNPSCSKFAAVESAGGRKASSRNALTISPNPGRSFREVAVSISGAGNLDGVLKVYDILGREMAQMPAAEKIHLDGSRSRLNTAGPGLYLFKLVSRGRVLAQEKFLKVN